MPYIGIHANHEITEDRKPKLLRLVSKIVQTEMGKPESTIMISIFPPEKVLFAGDETPSMFVEFKAIGIDATHTARLAASLCAALEQELNIPSRRIYIHFMNVEGAMWGWDKQTFQTNKPSRPTTRT